MNTMTEQDWIDVDASSRAVVSCLLDFFKAGEIGESNGCCCWDLSCTLKGVPTSVEIKARNIPHDRYDDVMIEQVKADATLRKA